jgi:glycosyltransferase involved in cell wall biosynthesis
LENQSSLSRVTPLKVVALTSLTFIMFAVGIYFQNGVFLMPLALFKPALFFVVVISLIPRIKSIRLADGIICISESTKNDLIRVYGIDERIIKVFCLASSFEVRAPTDLQMRRENFILYVGNRSGYKNFKVLLNAFGESHFLKSNFTLIAFGGGQFNEEEEEEIAKLNVGQSVIHIGGDDSRLRELYLTSKLLVYPSLYEGFGLPLLEAMSLGCPVITSEVSSMPEIGHEAVLYFDPSSAEGLQRLLEKTLLNEELLETLTQKGLARSAKFSWRVTAMETLDFYNKL